MSKVQGVFGLADFLNTGCLIVYTIPSNGSLATLAEKSPSAIGVTMNRHISSRGAIASNSHTPRFVQQLFTYGQFSSLLQAPNFFF
jgi:hypothetical protein